MKGLKELALRAPKAAKWALTKIMGDYQRIFTRSRMDGRPGLNIRTGSLSGNVRFHVEGTDIKSLVGRVGFFDRHAAMIARVHELGTVGAGGRLPDIVPRRKPMLAWPILRGDRSFVYKEKGPLKSRKRFESRQLVYAFAKKVAIPPRLQFFETWHRPFFQALVRRRIDEAEKKAVGNA